MYYRNLLYIFIYIYVYVYIIYTYIHIHIPDCSTSAPRRVTRLERTVPSEGAKKVSSAVTMAPAPSGPST